MRRIPNEFIQEVKSNVNIVDVIAKHVSLSKKGNNYMGSCPFHEDRNPSFSVSADKQIYHCFSCNRGGNLFSFVEEIEGLNFPEAVLKLAEDNGIAIPQEYYQQTQVQLSQMQIDLYEIHAQTSEFYHYCLMDAKVGEAALNYMLGRGYTKESLAEFQIGFAPENSELLRNYLKKQSFTEDTFTSSGIFTNEQDRFRGRIIIPLRNRQGKVIAFSGRTWQEHLNYSAPEAKYLNSPETEIFKKSELLFNLDLALGPIRQKKYVLIAEGYMDVMSLYQAGFTNVVAAMGTNLSAAALKQLSSLTKTIILSFDGDEAGQKASYKTLNEIQGQQGLTLRVMVIPDRMDPDEWLQTKGKTSFENLIKNSLSAFEFNQQFLRKTYNLKKNDELSKYIEAIIRLIKELPSTIEQELRIKDLAQEFQLSENILWEQLARLPKQAAATTRSAAESGSSKQTTYTSSRPEQVVPYESKRAYQSEKRILFNLIYHKEAWDYLSQRQTPPVFYHSFATFLYVELDKYYYAGNHLPLTGISHQVNDSQASRFLNELLWEEIMTAYSEEEMNDCFRSLDRAFLEREIEELHSKLSDYVKENRQIELEETSRRIMTLQKRIKLI